MDDETRPAEVRAKIQKGWAQSENGQMVDGAVFEAHFAQRSADARAAAEQNAALNEIIPADSSDIEYLFERVLATPA